MERAPEQSDATETLYTRSKARLGRLIGRTAVVTTATAVLFGGITATEVATDMDRQAQAADSLDSMNGAERAWCSWPSRWNLCLRVQELSGASLHVAEEIAIDKERRIHNGDGDAFRHCYWSGLMTKEFGWETAKGFGDRHEYNEDQHSFEASADLYNNRQGRIWAQQVDDIGRRCLDGMLNNELQIVIPYAR
jgi:hypothetical protein